MKFILGKKLGMTQVFKEDKVIPVTLIESGPNFVTQIKTKDGDGYTAIQVGFDTKKEKNISARGGSALGGQLFTFSFLRHIFHHGLNIVNFGLGGFRVKFNFNILVFFAKVLSISRGQGRFNGSQNRLVA